MVTTLNITLDDDVADQAREIKNERGLTWPEFIEVAADELGNNPHWTPDTNDIAKRDSSETPDQDADERFAPAQTTGESDETTPQSSSSASKQNHDAAESASRQTSGRDGDEPVPKEPEMHANASDAVIDAVESVATGWEDTPDRLENRKQAAAVALQHAVNTNEAVGKSSDIIEDVRATFSVEGQNEETYWRKNIRPVLKKYGEYSRGNHGYHVAADAIETSGGVYDPTEEF